MPNRLVCRTAVVLYSVGPFVDVAPVPQPVVAGGVAKAEVVPALGGDGLGERQVRDPAGDRDRRPAAELVARGPAGTGVGVQVEDSLVGVPVAIWYHDQGNDLLHD